MDTSDSEYFESADEDLESDPKPSHRQLPSHPIPEPELCALKINEEPVSKTSPPVEPEECNDNIEKPMDTAAVKDINNASITPQKNTTGKAQPVIPLEVGEKDEENLCKDNVQESVKTPVVNDNNSAAVFSPQKDTSGEAKPLVQRELAKENQENQCKNNLKDSDKTPVANDNNNSAATGETKSEPDQKTEENLWEDDEIDWETEATKEESHQPIREDSGWGDFEVDWEADKNLPNTNKEQEPTAVKTEENLWEDDWEPINKPKEEEHDKPPKEEDSSWGNWGTWGVTSLLNTATQSVSTITTHVSQVIESGIGIPDPEEMARLNRAQKEELREKSGSPTTPSAFGLGNFVSGVSQLTKFVESTSSKVITGGLGTLEAIGKKTVEVLQEGDPGLKKKKAFLKLDTGKPNLSQILREAKERAEEEVNSNKQNLNVEIRKIKNYETLFDDHEGLVHLEALEMLSKLCSIKLDNMSSSLSGESLKDLQETLEQVKELCEIPEDDEDEERVQLEKAKEVISEAVKEIDIPISYDKLFNTYEETDKWLEGLKLNFIDSVEFHQQAIDTLAQLTALAVEQFHKTGELLLVKEHRSTVDEADSLVQITTTLKSLILRKADSFIDKLNAIGHTDKEKINEQITNIFYEAENSGTYIQDAFNLLLPVLQVGVTSS